MSAPAVKEVRCGYDQEHPPMEIITNPYGGRCDGCQADIKEKTQNYSCTECDFYLCQKCAPIPALNSKWSNEVYEGLTELFFKQEQKSLNPSDPEIETFMTSWEELDQTKLPTKLFKQDESMTHLYAFLSEKSVVIIKEYWNDPKSYWYKVDSSQKRYQQDLCFPPVGTTAQVFAQSLSASKYLTTGEINLNKDGKDAQVCLVRLSIEKFKSLSQNHQERIKKVYEQHTEKCMKAIKEVTQLYDWKELSKNRSETGEDDLVQKELTKQYNSLNQEEQPGECHHMIVNKNPATGNVYDVKINPITRLPTTRHGYVHMAVEFKKDGILRYRVASFTTSYDAATQKWGQPQLDHWYRDITIGKGDYEKRIDPQTCK